MILTIKAGPGSGKTYCLTNALVALHSNRPQEIIKRGSEEQQEIFRCILENFPRSKKVAYFAMGRAVANKLQRESLPFAKSNTFHGHGAGQLNRLFHFQKRDFKRGEKILSDIIGRNLSGMSWGEKIKYLALLNFIEKMKIENLPYNENSVAYIREKYPNLTESLVPSDHLSLGPKVMEAMLRPNRSVEYADMVWMAAKSIPRPVYDIGFVDEYQDLSACQLLLAHKLCHHLIFCGDPDQAINAFSGGRVEIAEEIEESADVVLPLKMSRRCPPNIIERLNNLKPDADLKPLPETRPGIEEKMKLSEFQSFLRGRNPKTTLIMSRTNANLYKTWFYLYKNKVPAYVVGDDMENQIVGLIKKLRPTSVTNLIDKANDFADKEHKNPLVTYINKEKVGIIVAMAEDAKEIDDVVVNLKKAIEPTKDGFPLSTIHKAKGQEADTCCILFPPVENQYAMKNPHTAPQELNLHYVAESRTKRDLYEVL